MTESLLQLLIPILLAAVAVNLLLMVRIAAIVRETPEPQDLPFTLELDNRVPSFSGRKLLSGETVSLEDLAGTPVVLTFLSSGCADCRGKLPELARILPATRIAGVELFIVGMEGEKRIRKFLEATPLAEHVLLMSRSATRKLNPRSGSPFYVFIDHEGVAKASNFIGDESWINFLEQMSDVDVKEHMGDAHGAPA